MSVPNVGKTHYRSGGTRGGADRFDWNDVKSDTYRENYIGHSLHAPIGRHYAGGKDHLWWTKQKTKDDDDNDAKEKEKSRKRDSKKRKGHKNEKKDRKRKKRFREERGRSISDSDQDQERENEKLQMKKMEEEMMAQALGLAPKREDYGAIKQLDASEMRELLQKGTSERTEVDGERIRGLGSGMSKRHDFVDADVRKRGRDANYFTNIDTTESMKNDASSSFSNANSTSREYATEHDSQKESHRSSTSKSDKNSKKKSKKKKKKKRSSRHDSSDDDSADERLQKLLKQSKHRFY
mmetsp:Transcript_3558/g.4474  ORF Transcript_3558/g.4474 Transcript_3558/m.4474 type:complete len:295 (-) Transcript_3558:1773-2657(-)